MLSHIWGKGNGRGKSGFEVNRDTVNRSFTVHLSRTRDCAYKLLTFIAYIVYFVSNTHNLHLHSILKPLVLRTTEWVADNISTQVIQRVRGKLKREKRVDTALEYVY